MSTTLTPPVATPRVSETIFKGRWIIAGLVLLTVMALASAFLTTPLDRISLSIHNAHANGSRALAEVLNQQGVPVQDVYSPADMDTYGEHDTVVITNLNQIPDAPLREIMHKPTNLLVLGTFAQGSRLQPYVKTSGAGSADQIAADCTFPPARTAGYISHTRGSLTPLREPDVACFPVDEKSFAYLAYERSEGYTLAFLSENSLARNDSITLSGNAALLLNLLSTSGKVGWANGEIFQQGSADEQNTPPMLPAFFTHALILLAVSAFVFTLAQGRRLGRVVPEELPVIVHGAESVYGRAGMYEKSKAFRVAARTAREHTAKRLGKILQIPTPTTPEVMVKEVASYTGVPETQVAQLLYGEVPSNARELGNLLKNLEQLKNSNPGKDK